MEGVLNDPRGWIREKMEAGKWWTLLAAAVLSITVGFVLIESLGIMGAVLALFIFLAASALGMFNVLLIAVLVAMLLKITVGTLITFAAALSWGDLQNLLLVIDGTENTVLLFSIFAVLLPFVLMRRGLADILSAGAHHTHHTENTIDRHTKETHYGTPPP